MIAAAAHPGVVAHDVHRAELVERPVAHRVDVGGDRHVGLDADDRGAAAPQFGHGRRRAPRPPRRRARARIPPAANRSARARPMPLAPPVTTATRSRKSSHPRPPPLAVRWRSVAQPAAAARRAPPAAALARPAIQPTIIVTFASQRVAN